MGGKKRLTLSQMRRAQERKGKEEKKEVKKEKGGAAAAGTKAAAGILPPDPGQKGVVEKLRKVKALTPYAVATSLDLRVGAARHLLQELESRGAVELVSGSRNLKVYRVADQPK